MLEVIDDRRLGAGPSAKRHASKAACQRLSPIINQVKQTGFDSRNTTPPSEGLSQPNDGQMQRDEHADGITQSGKQIGVDILTVERKQILKDTDRQRQSIKYVTLEGRGVQEGATVCDRCKVSRAFVTSHF